MSAFPGLFSSLVQGKTVPASGVSGSVRRAIQPLIAEGVISLQKYGRGARYVLHDLEALKVYLHKHYPGKSVLPPKRRKKARSCRQVTASEAKRSMAQGAATADMRFFSGKLTYPDVVIDANKVTRQLGVVSAQIYSDTPLRMECRKVAIVDNLELFYYVEHVHESLDCALYAGQRIHNALLDWLYEHDEDIEFIYFGAYSPLGAQEYIRLRDRLAAPVVFYIPDNLDTLFSRHIDQDLLREHIAEYRKIRSENDPSVKKLVDLMANHGGGIGQEVLLMGDG